MCGIVGAAASRDIVHVLIEGLRRLEYRGYDSCGVAVHQGGELRRARSTSRVSELDAQVLKDGVEGLIGIGQGVVVGNRPDDRNLDEVAVVAGQGVHKSCINDLVTIGEVLEIVSDLGAEDLFVDEAELAQHA